MPKTPHHHPSRKELEASLIRALGPLQQKLSRALDCELTAFGLSRALAAPLLRIWRNDGVHQCELAGALDIEGPSLVRLLDQLTAAGLVIRRIDAHDQRARMLHLTAEGTALARRVMPVIERHRSRLLNTTSCADMETCLRVFERILAECESTANTAAK